MSLLFRGLLKELSDKVFKMEDLSYSSTIAAPTWLIFLGLKPSRDQDGADKKRISQIGPAVLEEIGRKHTYIHLCIVLIHSFFYFNRVT